MPEHPYKLFPSRQFWSRAVANNFDAGDTSTTTIPLITKNDKIASAGSCFAANLVPFLEKEGFNYIRTENTEPFFSQIPAENMSYAKFSAAYGNIYTTRQLNQLLLRCLGDFHPIEDRWITPQGVFDPFRPGLRYYATCEREFELLTEAHLKATLAAFMTCDVFIFTLGLTEAWRSKIDGAVYPACPGTIAGAFSPERHEFINFQVNEVAQDLFSFIHRLRTINSAVRIVLTVSPVPLVATASEQHVLVATVYSKSVLRVAAEMACTQIPDVFYFPAYEIASGPQAPDDFFAADKRTISETAVNTIMSAFLSQCDQKSVKEKTAQVDHSEPEQKPSANLSAFSQFLVDVECEEAALDC